METTKSVEQKVKFWANLVTAVIVVAGLFYCITGMMLHAEKHF